MLGTRRSRIAYPLTIVGGALLLALLLFARPTPEPKPLSAAPIPRVDVIEIREQLLPRSVYSQGVISAAQRIEVVAEVSGRVEAIAEQFAAGGSFAASEELLTINATDYRAALSTAEANIAEAKRQLASERGAARQAKREWRDLNSQEANDLFLRKPQLASAEAALQAAIAGRDKAEQDLARTRLSLPFAGKVISKSVDLGEYVVAGRSIAEVFALDSAELRLPLSTDQLYKLGSPIGAEVLISNPSAGAGFQWQGRLSRVEPAVDPVSRLHHVVVELQAPFSEQPLAGGGTKPALALGQFVEAVISSNDLQAAFLIPRQALRQPQSIWVLDRENRLLVLPVEILESNREQALLRLADAARQMLGDEFIAEPMLRLVSSDLSLVVSGMQVQVGENPVASRKESSAAFGADAKLGLEEVLDDGLDFSPEDSPAKDVLSTNDVLSNSTALPDSGLPTDSPALPTVVDSAESATSGS